MPVFSVYQIYMKENEVEGGGVHNDECDDFGGSGDVNKDNDDHGDISLRDTIVLFWWSTLFLYQETLTLHTILFC